MPAAVPSPAHHEAEALMSTEEVAAYLRVSPSTIHDWRLKAAGPPAFKVGRHLRFRRAEVDEWLEARRGR